MSNRFIIYLYNNTLHGYYIGNKKQNTQGKIIPNLSQSMDELIIKIFPNKSLAITTGKDLVGHYLINGGLEVYSFPNNKLIYKANYIRGQLEREQYYE